MLKFIKQLEDTWIFRQDIEHPTIFNIIGWWEFRRILFNIVLGVVGTIVMLINGMIDFTFAYTNCPDDPNFAVVIYAFMANVCYTGGELLQICLNFRSPQVAKDIAEKSFKKGFYFSICLTTLPAVLYIIVSIIKLFVLLNKK